MSTQDVTPVPLDAGLPEVSAPVVAVPEVVVPAEGAAQNLALRIATYTQRGYLVQSQTSSQVVLVRPKTKINHLLHFFISVFTLGLWIFGWIFVVLSKKRTKSVILHVNPDGSIVEQSV